MIDLHTFVTTYIEKAKGTAALGLSAGQKRDATRALLAEVNELKDPNWVLFGLYRQIAQIIHNVT